MAIALGACYRHAAEPARARCPDCQRNICCACFGAAAWPWKVCSECEPKRVQTAAARSAPAEPVAESLICPWCGQEGTGVAAERRPCSGCGTGLLAAEAGRAQFARRESGQSQPGRRAPAPGAAVEREEAPGAPFGKMLLFLVAVALLPLLAWSFASGVRNAYESGWQPPTTSGPRVQSRPVVVLTAETCRGEAAFWQDCDRYNTASWVEGMSLFAALLGPALAAFIVVASWLGGRSRVLLLLLFLPGLYVTLGGLLLLVGLQGLLVLGIIWAIGAALPVFVPLAIGGAALFGVVNIASAVLSSVKRPTTGVFGKPVGELEAPGLWRVVRDLAARLGARPPRHIVVGLEPGFWVTETDVHALAGRLRGRTMYLSLPLCRVLARDELSAILGHELAHYRGLDTRFSQMFYPVYRAAGQSLAALDHATDESFLSWLTLLPAQVVLEFFYKRFAEAESAIGRARELAADRASADVISARAAATALIKAHAFDDCWVSVRGLMRGALSRGQTLPNASLAYAEIVRREAVPSVLEGLDDQRLPHPTDSHPPLHARLKALGVSLADIGSAALAVCPAEPAIALIENAEEIERELSASIPEEMVY